MNFDLLVAGMDIWNKKVASSNNAFFFLTSSEKDKYRLFPGNRPLSSVEYQYHELDHIQHKTYGLKPKT